MRCDACQYPLWNIRPPAPGASADGARHCPECGAPFKPSDFEFVLNSVRFCCPHCNQEYYGTGDKGHLVPPEFDCVKCARRISMDEMVLTPTEGVSEQQTQVELNPWLGRRRWWSSGPWLKTIWRALFSPARLARTTPADSSVWQALWFGVRTNLSYTIIGAAPLFLFPLLFVGFARPGAGAASVVATTLMSLLAGLVGLLVLLLLALVGWALSAHAILRLTGPTTNPLGRTIQTLCYASGANAASAVPCIGMYTIPIGWGWSAVSGALMLRETQGVKGVRASFAAATGPAVALILTVGAAFALMFGGMRMASGMAKTMAPAALVGARETYFATNGRWPAHPVELLGTGTSGSIGGFNFTATRQGSVTNSMTIGAGGRNLFAFPTTGASRTAAIAAAVAEIPPGAAAHRVGDVVFTDIFSAGLPAGDTGPRWIMIVHPDPASNMVPPAKVEVFTSDGASKTHSAANFAAALTEENTRRTFMGLPPIPDPMTIVGPAPVPIAPFTPGDPDAEYVDDSETEEAPPPAPPPTP